jgi:hypothetical protein
LDPLLKVVVVEAGRMSARILSASCIGADATPTIKGSAAVPKKLSVVGAERESTVNVAVGMAPIVKTKRVVTGCCFVSPLIASDDALKLQINCDGLGCCD